MPAARSRRPLTAAAAALATLALAACTADPGGDDQRVEGTGSGSDRSATEPFEAALRVDERGGRVAVDSVVTVAAERGTLDQVVAYHGQRGSGTTMAGDMTSDGVWTLQDDLEPGRTYTVVSTGSGEAGDRRTVRDTFSTDELTLDEQTYPSVAPLAGETVGVGMPVIVTFDVPVTDRASIERHLSVRSSPRVDGSWHWLSDTEVHYRPRTFWPTGADVDVDVDVNSVDAGNGIYGQESRQVSFGVGDSVISTIDVDTHQMRVDINGQTARTVPISAGKAGFETRGGTKVIIEKFESKRMDAATTGIQPGDPEYYNIANVEYAMRVTYTGEFLHAAPWSVGSQGSANVSHGCVGMSTENAAWLYGLSHRGDVVQVVGSDRPLEQGNGWTDWDLSWAEYRAGSSLT